MSVIRTHLTAIALAALGLFLGGIGVSMLSVALKGGWAHMPLESDVFAAATRGWWAGAQRGFASIGQPAGLAVALLAFAVPVAMGCWLLRGADGELAPVETARFLRGVCGLAAATAVLCAAGVAYCAAPFGRGAVPLTWMGRRDATRQLRQTWIGCAEMIGLDAENGGPLESYLPKPRSLYEFPVTGWLTGKPGEKRRVLVLFPVEARQREEVGVIVGRLDVAGQSIEPASVLPELVADPAEVDRAIARGTMPFGESF